MTSNDNGGVMISDNRTIGAAFIGCLLSATFWGITCSQVYLFFRHYPKESRIVKAAVACICLLDTIHVIFVTHASYWWMVTNFLNSDIVKAIPWSLWTSQILASSTDLIVRLFFLYRIWILSNHCRSVYVFLVISFIPWFMLVTLSSIGLRRLHTVDAAWGHKWMFFTGIGVMTFEDCCIALSLSYYLFKARSDISSQTNSTVRVLILYTVNTGLIATIFSVICIVTYAAIPRSFVYLTMFLPMSQLYINALLASLNARNWLRSDLGDIQIPLKPLFKQNRTRAEHPFNGMNIRATKHQTSSSNMSVADLDRKTGVDSTSDTLADEEQASVNVHMNGQGLAQRVQTNESVMITVVVGGEEKRDIPISMN